MKPGITKLLFLFAVALCLSGAGIGQAASSIAAADIVVTTFSDTLNSDSECSLREAIHTANGNLVTACSSADQGPGATIYLQAGTYSLTQTGRDDDLNISGDLDLRRSMNIIGLGQGITIVDGNASDRVFELVVAGIHVSISQVTIQNGDILTGPEGGAGVLVGYETTLNLYNCRVTNNNAPNSLGGGIDNYQGTVTITNCTIDNNTASEGGGIYNDKTLYVYQSLINENDANLHGGGMKNKEPNAVTILENVTISRNNCNIGSGIYSNDEIYLTNSTVVRNVGTGYAFINLGKAVLVNNIIALNYQINCSGNEENFTSNGGNIDDGNTCYLDGVGDLVNTNPFLVGDEPQDNGGPTRTYALQDNSPAIDAGNPVGSPASDQRGYPRPVDGDDDGVAICDIGAYEAPMRMYFPIIFR